MFVAVIQSAATIVITSSGSTRILSMTKQLRIEAERLWKRGEELKDQLIKMQKENARLREALRKIGHGPPHEGEPLDLLNQFVDLACDALKDKQ